MKNKLLLLTAMLLSCCTLTLNVSAESNADEGNTVEMTAVSHNSEPSVQVAPIQAPPYAGAEDTAPEEGEIEPAVDVTVSPAFDPNDPSAPIAEPVPNETAPSSFWSSYPEGTGNIENIAEYWEINGYPDDVSFVIDDGIATYYPATQTEVVDHLWTIGAVNMSKERKAEICALVAAGQHLQFVECTYSYKQRSEMKNMLESIYPKAIVELKRDGQAVEVYLDQYDDEKKEEIIYEIKAKFDSGIVIVYFVTPDIGIPETAIEEIGDEIVPEITAAATVQAPTGETDENIGQHGNPPQIVDAPTTAAEAPENAITKSEENENDIGVDATGIDIGGETAIASNIDFIAPTDGIQTEGDSSETFPETLPENGVAAIVMDNTQKESDNFLLWLCSVAAAALLITAAVIIGKRHSKALSLAGGGEVRHSGKLGKAEIVSAIKKSTVEPSGEVYNKIVDKIKI